MRQVSGIFSLSIQRSGWRRNQIWSAGVVRHMTERQKLVPDASHPIEVVPTQGRVVVSRLGSILADSTRALTLREVTIPAVQYVPFADVDATLLERTSHSTYCPYKGEAAYYSIVVGEERAENAVWTYESPYEAVAEIAGHVAFYPDQVDITIA